ncbi:Cuticle protein 6 [Armadillidium nasatum]|uniref:Cuticle protein 6 n=1 Tax=Armadillidium nasatum TaxID=96803 RepID=A0A5N5SK64_9CRUS|nr:Cuticle protein 6 [Armadillidium nasatum]
MSHFVILIIQVLFTCLCISLANAKSFFTQPFVGTPQYTAGSPFVFVNPTQFTPQVIPTFRTVATPISTVPYVFNRFHTQDRTGAYTFSYSGGPSSRTESRDRFGNVVGAFNYVDPEGKIQTQQYVADSNGFRVAGTNLPTEPFVKVKETEKSRVKRETTVGKTPASTVPLKTVPVHHVVPQTYSNVVAPQIVPNFFTVNPNIIPNVYTASKTPVTTFPYNVPNVYTASNTPVTFPYNVPNVYTSSKTPVPTFPYNVFPTFYTVPTVIPTTDTKTTTNEKTDSVPVQPVVYSGVTNPYYTYDPNFITRQVEGQKTPNTGFTFYY